MTASLKKILSFLSRLEDLLRAERPEEVEPWLERLIDSEND